MATPIKEKNGKTYGVRASRMLKNGEREQKYKGGFKNKTTALAWVTDWRNEFKNSTLINSLNELIPYFLDVKLADGISERTHMDYLLYLNIIQLEFEDIELKCFTPTILQTFLNKYKNTQAKCRHLKSTLSALFTVAFKQEIIESNPMLRVIPPKYERKNISFYDNIQAKNLLDILKTEQPMHYPFALLLILTGMRPNEATVLLTEDIMQTPSGDYYISINKALSEARNYLTKETMISLKKPKSIAGVRSVPFSTDMLQELYYFKNKFKIESKYVVCDSDGNPLSLNCFHQALKRSIKRHDLPHITAYGLRHTFGNLNKRAGVDSYTVSKLMGHSDPKITEQNYYHDDVQLNTLAIEKVTNLIK